MPHRAKQQLRNAKQRNAHRTESPQSYCTDEERFTDEFHWRFHDAG